MLPTGPQYYISRLPRELREEAERFRLDELVKLEATSSIAEAKYVYEESRTNVAVKIIILGEDELNLSSQTTLNYLISFLRGIDTKDLVGRHITLSLPKALLSYLFDEKRFVLLGTDPLDGIFKNIVKLDQQRSEVLLRKLRALVNDLIQNTT